MKYFLTLTPLSMTLLLLFNSVKAQLPLADTIKTRKGNVILQPVFHGALVLNMAGKTIYIDPYNSISVYKTLDQPDLILITDIHQDHLDTTTLNTINSSKARFVVPQAVADKLPARFKTSMSVLRNGESMEESGISITAIPMYNLPETSDSRHTKGRGNGYVIEYGGKRIYISGDTEDITEMRRLKNIDVAFICMNQPFTMTIQQAASAVLEFKPKILYPYHYRDMNGFSDVNAFRKLVLESNKSIDVRIREWYAEELPENKVTKFESVVYGSFSGTALTMDIYKPYHSNKLGIIVIPGSAFGYAYTTDYNQRSMTENFADDTVYFGKDARKLVEKGYTIFVINHRLAPQFRYTDVLGDCQRAVRFIRFHSKKYGIDPDNIGAFGYSSGATLCSMLGVTDHSRNTSRTSIDSVSSKVQSVVALAGRYELSDFNKREDSLIQNPIISKVLLNYIGELPAVENGIYVSTGKYAEASPVTYVSRETASFLIYCSENDPLVPLRQAIHMHKKLFNSGIEAKLIISKNEGHNPVPNINEINRWFLKQLKQ